MARETALPQAVQELIDSEAHRVADGIPSIFALSADPRSVIIDYFAGALNKVALRALEGRAQAPAPDLRAVVERAAGYQCRCSDSTCRPCLACEATNALRAAPPSTGAATPQEK